MATFGQADVFLLVGGYALTAYVMDGSFTREAITEQSDTWGDSWEEHSDTGIERCSLSIANGFYDDASNASNDALNERQGTSDVVVFGMAGTAIGSAAIGMSGQFAVNFNRTATRGQLHKFSGEYLNTGVVEENVIILHALGAESGDGDEEANSIDNSASSASGGSGYLEVTALTDGGYDDITVRVIDSSDDITFGELVSFTATTAAPSAERVTVSGTVERYVSTDWSWTGSGSGESATFLSGFVRN